MFIKTIRQRIGVMKLRNKLMISYFVASVVPILVISFTIYQLSAESIEEASEEFASLYISQATTNLDNFVERHDQSTRSVLLERDIMQILSNDQPVSMEKLIENKTVIQRFFSRMSTVCPEIETIMLVDTKGEIYHYTRAPDKVNPTVLQQQAWFDRIRESQKSLFFTPVHDKSYYGNDKEGASFTVGRVLWNYSGSYAGIILLDMDPSHLIQLSKDFLTIGNRYDTRLIITDEDGGLFYHSDAAMGKRPWSDFIGGKYNAKGAKDDTILLSEVSSEGLFRLSTEIPLNKLLARINSIKHVTILAINACLLFIVLISIFFSFKITKPILDLRRSMKQVELGHYSFMIQVPSANDEISGLVKSYNNMIQKIKELIEDVFLAGMKRKQAQFLALQSQINPHMLYNTLESIRMKAVVKEQDEIAEMIKILARMFRHSLGRQPERNLVRHEVEYAANYIFLQNIRYDNRFTLEVDLSEQVLDTPIIPLAFQPIVENSIKHGFRDYSKHLYIRIEEVRTESNDVLIRITDNGTSLSEEKANEINHMLQQMDVGVEPPIMEDREADTGIGLRNIAERLKLQYGEQYYLRINAERGKGAVVEMLIPLHDK